MGIRGLFSGLGNAVLLLSLFSGTNASAEPTAASSATSPPENTTTAANVASGTDIVRLKNGGVVRGTISELLPGASVTIVSVAGKTHEFPMSEVSYAGPESQSPVAAAPTSPAPASAPAPKKAPIANLGSDSNGDAKPYVTVHGAQADLHLESEPPGLTFHRENSSATAGGAHATGYERLCTSPCDISLPAGTENLAVSSDDKSPISAGSVTFPAGQSKVIASIHSNAGIRIGGVVLAVASAAIGFTLEGTALAAKKMNTGQLIAGVAVLSLGTATGVALAFYPNTASARVAPNAAPSPAAEPSARLSLPGLAFRGAF